MKRLMFAVCAAVLAAGTWAQDVSADDSYGQDVVDLWTPLAISLIPGLDFPPSEYAVTGLSLGLLAERHPEACFLTMSTVADLIGGDMIGLQFSGCYNQVGLSSGAIQVTCGANSVDGDFTGIQLGGVYNKVRRTMSGLTVAVITETKQTDGLQVGFFNKTKAMNGVQIGVVNLAEESEGGIQLGAFNIMKDAKYPVMPVFNVGF